MTGFSARSPWRFALFSSVLRRFSILSFESALDSPNGEPVWQNRVFCGLSGDLSLHGAASL
jgi:hypothetical protein